MRAALDRVLDEPEYAAAAGRLAEETAAMPPPTDVAKAVEEHVTRG